MPDAAQTYDNNCRRVVLIAVGVAGGFKMHDVFFSPNRTYQTIEQLIRRASGDISDARNTAVVRAAKKASPAVVGITTKVYDRDIFNRRVLVGEGVGSGIIFDKAGYIATNQHVVGNSKTVIVSLADGQSTEGTVIGRDEKTDLAVVKINVDNLPVAESATATPCRSASRLLLSEILWDLNFKEPLRPALSVL